MYVNVCMQLLCVWAPSQALVVPISLSENVGTVLYVWMQLWCVYVREGHTHTLVVSLYLCIEPKPVVHTVFQAPAIVLLAR